MLSISFFACSDKKGGPPSISIDGSSTVFPVSEAVAEEFMAVNPNVRVTVGESGTGGGFSKFSNGKIDINDASRPIKSKEDSACKANNIAYESFMVAYDGMAIVVHPSNTWCNDITVEELKRLWEPSARDSIMTWNQIRSDWPVEQIRLFGPGTQSGTFDYFTEAIVGTAKECRTDYTASEDDNVLVQGVAADKNAFGYFGLAYYNNNKDKIKAVAVINPKSATPVLPSIETVKNKSYSPLSRPLFIYVTDLALERQEVRDFIQFYIDNCAKLSESVGYVSLSVEELSIEEAKLAKFLEAHPVKTAQ
ncbi:MAG: PstS family phosphate ABC transporter substrate-binding protein [Flavobacteriales bacterium]|nr:PstS family phosphate ABC transporter substrate-binding protein [Flavobacteriales bacterium]